MRALWNVLSRLTGNSVTYRATVTDMIAYTRPWTIEIPLSRQNDELLEAACHEDNGDLQHLKDVRDEYRAKTRRRSRAMSARTRNIGILRNSRCRPGGCRSRFRPPFVRGGVRPDEIGQADGQSDGDEMG